MENLRMNFIKVYDELIKTTKKTKIAHGMGYSTTVQLYNSLDGTAMLSTKAIVNLIRNFNVNPTFLFNGVGEIFTVTNQSNVFEYTYVNSTL